MTLLLSLLVYEVKGKQLSGILYIAVGKYLRLKGSNRIMFLKIYVRQAQMAFFFFVKT